MVKLNQIISVEKGVKSRSHQELTAAHHGPRKPALSAGVSRAYQPEDESGEQSPLESTRVQVKAEATDKHPAQAELYCEDMPIGYWTTVKFSGALPACRCAHGVASRGPGAATPSGPLPSRPPRWAAVDLSHALEKQLMCIGHFGQWIHL